ncbi:pre-rRNA processing and 40S ribosomal subunit assembly [Neonectria magnoliae]|uniref:Pre-rRNA processing and 40S ribosomal subunit assembly n=1 Tax=Neonectria magnoliae TaxID=2732573 RepID=A0ABR1IB18_9HYPO
MAVLGKRKAREEPSISAEDSAAIFRRHFEAQFSPLPATRAKTTKAVPDDDDDDSDDDDENQEDKDSGEDDDEWGGLSDEETDEDEEDPAIEVVDHTSAQPPKPTPMSNREFKAFMSSRPPDQTYRATEVAATTTTSSSAIPEDAPSLLAQDLELRRLIAESHLLAPALTAAGTLVAPKAFAAGRTRQKATDLRVQALGSKISIHKQEKMPMNIRKGIVAASGARETKRRREAKENGVILERETSKKSKRKERGRDLAVDRPGVGRLKGAELRLSDRDVRGIEGVRDTFGRRGGKR